MRQANPYALVDLDASDNREGAVDDLQREQHRWRERLANLPTDHSPEARATILLELADCLADLDQDREAWDQAREAFTIFAAAQRWEEVVRACDILFRTNQPGSMAALGQGIWLAVTYPIAASWTVVTLQHLIEETPPESNVPPIAAAVSHYVAGLRVEDSDEGRHLLDYTQVQLALVAGRHRGVQTQDEFDAWMIGNELDEPARFLPRLAEAVDNLVQGDWWIDRDALRRKLPVND
ncbi:conserved hypothetical protein [Gammaproteobacteria bacterium]